MSGGKESAAQPVDQGKEGGVSPPPKIDLRDANAIRREMGAVYREMRGKPMASLQDGTKLVYVLNMMRQACETSELQDRLDALEAKQNRSNDHAVGH